jgi:hypothetical protein
MSRQLLRMIKTRQIKPNPANPRGIDIPKDDDRFDQLKDSIRAFGIMVPLVVAPDDDNYILIDGERRLKAAQALQLEDVPAFIVNKKLDSKQILSRMFHIHHNREQWEAIPQCKALEGYYKSIISRGEIRSIKPPERKIKVIADELSTEAGIDPKLARDRALFLSWPKDIKEYLYNLHDSDDIRGHYLYITEIEKHIILPALKNYPEYFKKVPVNTVRRFLYKKLGVASFGKKIQVRDAVPLVRFQARNQIQKKKVLNIFGALVNDEKMGFDEARDEFYRQVPEALKEVSPSPQKLLTAMNNLKRSIDAFDIESLKRASAKRKLLSSMIEQLNDSLTNLLDEFTQA